VALGRITQVGNACWIPMLYSGTASTAWSGQHSVWTAKAYCRVHKSPKTVSTLRQTSPATGSISFKRDLIFLC